MQIKIPVTESSIQFCLGEKTNQKEVWSPSGNTGLLHPFCIFNRYLSLALYHCCSLEIAVPSTSLLIHPRQTFWGILKAGRDNQVYLSHFNICQGGPSVLGFFSGARETGSFGESVFSCFLRKMAIKQAWIHSMLFCCGFSFLVTLHPDYPLGCRPAPRPLESDAAAVLFSPPTTPFLLLCCIVLRTFLLVIFLHC